MNIKDEIQFYSTVKLNYIISIIPNLLRRILKLMLPLLILFFSLHILCKNLQVFLSIKLRTVSSCHGHLQTIKHCSIYYCFEWFSIETCVKAWARYVQIKMFSLLHGACLRGNRK